MSINNVPETSAESQTPSTQLTKMTRGAAMYTGLTTLIDEANTTIDGQMVRPRLLAIDEIFGRNLTESTLISELQNPLQLIKPHYLLSFDDLVVATQQAVERTEISVKDKDYVRLDINALRLESAFLNLNVQYNMAALTLLNQINYGADVASQLSELGNKYLNRAQQLGVAQDLPNIRDEFITDLAFSIIFHPSKAIPAEVRLKALNGWNHLQSQKPQSAKYSATAQTQKGIKSVGPNMQELTPLRSVYLGINTRQINWNATLADIEPENMMKAVKLALLAGDHIAVVDFLSKLNNEYSQTLIRDNLAQIFGNDSTFFQTKAEESDSSLRREQPSNTDLSHQIAVLSQQLTEAQTQLFKVQKSFNASVANVETLNDEIEILKGTIKDLGLEIVRLEKENRQYETRFRHATDLQAENADLKKKIKDLESRGGTQQRTVPNFMSDPFPPLTADEVAAIQRAMARLNHPDKGGDPERMKLWTAWARSKKQQ